MDDVKILQIMPATGWYAVYEDGNSYRLEPLIGWALVEDLEGDMKGTRFVVGMTVNHVGEFAYTPPGYECCIHESEAGEWRKKSVR